VLPIFLAVKYNITGNKIPARAGGGCYEVEKTLFIIYTTGMLRLQVRQIVFYYPNISGKLLNHK
jgi:hypothetical protein